MLTEVSRQRDFPSLENRIYLNTAAEGIPPVSVLEALGKYGQDKELGMDGRLLHEVQDLELKARTADFYGLKPENIGVCSCSSEAYNLAFSALNLKSDDEVIINDLDFPAGATPWLTTSSAATVKIWRSRDGVLVVEDLIKLLSPKTRFVNTSLVSFYNGSQIDVDEVSDAVRKYSPALLGVDVTQALGRLTLKLDRADLIVSSTHKWILGTHGGGLVGVSPERADEWTVPVGGWLNLENAFDDSRFEGVQNKRGAASFSVGMPNYAAIYANNAALKYISEVGIVNIENSTRDLVAFCRDGVRELPVELLGPANPVHPSGIIAFKHSNFQKINDALHAQGIHTMAHAGRIRVAIHGYNTRDDIEVFLETLARAISATGRPV